MDLDEIDRLNMKDQSPIFQIVLSKNRSCLEDSDIVIGDVQLIYFRYFAKEVIALSHILKENRREYCYFHFKVVTHTWMSGNIRFDHDHTFEKLYAMFYQDSIVESWFCPKKEFHRRDFKFIDGKREMDLIELMFVCAALLIPHQEKNQIQIDKYGKTLFSNIVNYYNDEDENLSLQLCITLHSKDQQKQNLEVRCIGLFNYISKKCKTCNNVGTGAESDIYTGDFSGNVISFFKAINLLSDFPNYIHDLENTCIETVASAIWKYKYKINDLRCLINLHDEKFIKTKVSTLVYPQEFKEKIKYLLTLKSVFNK